MKIFQQPKYLAVLTLLFFTCSVSSLLAKSKDKDRWNSKYETEIYLFGEKTHSFPS